MRPNARLSPKLKMMIKMLVIPGTALGVAGCISTIRSPDTRHEGQVYLGTLYRGPGLYLVNVPEPTCKSQPHLTLTGVTTNLDITIDVVNGYEKEILLRLPDRKTTETIRIGHIVGYDHSGNMISEAEGRVCAMWPDYHRKYENLMGRLGVHSNKLSFCCCSMQPWRIHEQLEFRPDRETSEEDSMKSDDGCMVFSDRVKTVDLTLELTLTYAVSGDPHWYENEVEIVVRIERPTDDPPQFGKDPPTTDPSDQPAP